MGMAWDEVKEQAYESVRDVKIKEEKHTHSNTYQGRCDDDKGRQDERGCERGEKS